MLNRSLKPLIVVFLLLTSMNLMAGFPIGEVTTLPPPQKDIDIQDAEALTSIMTLSVYQDSADPNLYYYVPPFRVLPYDQGAGSLLLHTAKSDQVAQANLAMEKMQSEEAVVPESVTNGPVLNSKREWMDLMARNLEETKRNLATEIKDINLEIKRIISKLEEATEKENSKLISFYEKSLADKNIELVNIKNDGNLKVAADSERYEAVKIEYDAAVADSIKNWQRRRLYNVVTNLAGAGRSIKMGLYPQTEDLVDVINNTLDELKKSFGGTLIMNIYSGFTERQLEDIRALKAKYWPNIKVSLILANDLKFTALTQMEKISQGIKENSMFESVRGSGGYHGATVAFDLTIDGAISLGADLGPFILPVGVSAVIREEIPAFEGYIKCDLKDKVNIAGRTDVIDGWVIFDNDVRNSLKGESDNGGKCTVDIIKGDPTSANYYKLKAVEEALFDAQIRKIKISQIEARDYYEKSLQDLDEQKAEAKKGKDKPNWTETMHKMSYREQALRTISSAASTFWHTTKLDTGRADKLNFVRVIKEPKHESIRKDMPANLCLYFNPKRGVYDRCTRAQEELAKNSVPATADAFASSECQEAKSMDECRKMRAEKAPELKPLPEEKIVDNKLYI